MTEALSELVKQQWRFMEKHGYVWFIYAYVVLTGLLVVGGYD